MAPSANLGCVLLCFVPMLIVTASAAGAAPVPAEGHLKIVRVALAQEEGQHLAEIELAGDLPPELSDSRASVEWDLLIDSDRNPSTSPWGRAPQFANDIGVDHMVRLCLHRDMYWAEARDCRVTPRRVTRVGFRKSGTSIWLMFSSGDTGEAEAFDYVVCVRKYVTEGGRSVLSVSDRYPQKGHFVFGADHEATTNTRPADPPPFRMRFVIDRKLDKRGMFRLFQCHDPATTEARAQSMGVEVPFAMRVKRAASYAEIRPDLDRLVDAEYARRHDEMLASKAALEEHWRSALPEFSAAAVAVTGHDWFYGEYRCLVTAFRVGVTSWHGNVIGVRHDQAPRRALWILTHELLLSHVFHIVRSRYTPEELDDWRVWAFAEISAVLVKEDPRLHPLAPSMVGRSQNHFARSNYPQLAPLEDALRALFVERKDFNDYLDRAVPILKEFTNTHQPGNGQ